MSMYYKQRWEIIFLSLHPEGPKWAQERVAKYLKISPGMVQMWITRYKDTGSVDDVPRTGRSRATNEKQDMAMVKIIDENPTLTSEEVANKISKKGVIVSSRTVRRRLNQSGLNYGRPTKKPLLKPEHIKKRLNWASENINRDWSRVVFTDESTFRYNQCINRLWKRKGEHKIVRVVKSSTKVNLYGSFSARGFGKLVIFTGNLTGKKLVQIYKRGLLPSAQKMYGNKTSNWILQEDNDPKHKSRVANAWKAENNIQVMSWPPYSPDCNPIENVWGLLKTKLARKKYKSIRSFISNIKKEWNDLSRDYAVKLAESCQQRCASVIENGGDWILY